MLRLSVRSISFAALAALALVTPLALSAPLAHGGEPPPAPTITVVAPYVRLLPPAAKHTAAFFVLDNKGKRDAKLVAASTEVARCELHNHVMVDGVMTMRPVTAIDIPAGGRATLAPGGLHVMLMDLARPLVENEIIKLTLRFDDGSTLEVAAPVRASAPAGP